MADGQRLTYDQAFEDHSYLWETYAPAKDMSGAYVDQDDLDKLLRSPTKTTARQCLETQIIYWFEAGPDCEGDDWKRDPIVEVIRERYGALWGGMT